MGAWVFALPTACGFPPFLCRTTGSAPVQGGARGTSLPFADVTSLAAQFGFALGVGVPVPELL